MNVAHTMSSVLERVKKKNLVGKGENAGNQHFLLFPPSLSYKASLSGLLKLGIVW